MTLDLFPDKGFAAMLFDMDGTILNSIAAAEKVWASWARAHGIDIKTFLPTIHGRRAIDTIASLNLPGVDAATEAAYITQAEIAEVEGIEEIPGATAFLNKIPPSKWAVADFSSTPTGINPSQSGWFTNSTSINHGRRC